MWLKIVLTFFISRQKLREKNEYMNPGLPGELILNEFNEVVHFANFLNSLTINWLR